MPICLPAYNRPYRRSRYKLAGVCYSTFTMEKATYIDTHAHLNNEAFAADIAAVMAACDAAGVAMINIGTDKPTSVRAVELAEQYDSAYAIIGLHPTQTLPEVSATGELITAAETFDQAAYRALAQNKRVVGLGECGLDYFYHTSAAAYAVQEQNFIAQIALANELQLPLMIHTRGPKPGQVSPTGRSVYADVYELLRQYAKVPFNVHFYAGTLAEAEKFFSLGGTVSFTGVITFAKDYEAVVREVPLELLHGETDCPYVAPVPHRGKRCEPWMVQEVYKKIAAIKGLDEEVVRLQLLENARRFYNI